MSADQPWVAGVDGCRAGWVVVLRSNDGEARARVVPTFAEVLTLPEQPRAIGVDMPIGLATVATAGGRACDVLARRRLGPRAASIFSPPTRGALVAFQGGADYRVVAAANRAGDPAAPGLSKQTFHLMRKVAEVDAALTPRRCRVIREVHPELSFTAGAGAPMRHAKRTAAGRAERVRVLRGLGFRAPTTLLGQRLPRGVAMDDLLDACIVCWTAGRLLTGAADALPPTARPPRDARGLPMQLWC